MTAYEWIARLHAVIGGLALLSFWGAGLSPKGRSLHVRSGQFYLASMMALLASALMLAVAQIALSNPAGWFLGFLLILTATTCWMAWRSIRDKRDFGRYSSGAYRVLATLNLLGGLAMAAYGWRLGQVIFVGFAVFGIAQGLGMFRLIARGVASDPRWWLREHLDAMTGNAIATHIAFLSIGLPRLFPALSGPLLQNLAWFGPVAVAVIVRLLVGRRYLGARPARAPMKTVLPAA